MMKKAIPFCLSVALLTSVSSLHAAAAEESSLFEVETRFSVVSIAPNIRFPDSFVYDQAFINIPESTSEVALGFTHGGGTFGAFGSQRARGYMRQRMTFDVWEPVYKTSSNPFYDYRATHTPVLMPFTGPQASFWTKAGLAPATAEIVHIHTNPMIEWLTAGGDVKTAPQTGNHILGPLSSRIRASENTNVIQTNLTRTFEWIAEKGTSTSPPHILRCIANAETAKPDCTETGLDLALFSEIKSVM
ncbi:MAG: hypothetical protein K0U37_06950, partial [Gammaproteobacteria bacterium]|nr:hypothetical protein [Gammaproteobacteria bacterium]